MTLDELEEILKWKLRKQFGRTKKKREGNTNDNVIEITRAAFSVTHTDKDFETKLKINLLSTLAGVKIPVASAILTLCFPTLYAVVDFRNWQVFNAGERKTSYTPNDYVKYLKKIRQEAKKYELTPQEIDIAIWQNDLEGK